MKTGFLLLFLSAGSLISGADPAQPATAPLSGAPAEITRFYHDVNFAACLCTPKERVLVNLRLKTNSTDRLSARLQAVAEAVQRIREASTFIDPQMVHDSGIFQSSAEELTEIVSMQRTGNRILVEVSTRSVSPETRSWLVAQFDHPTEKTAAADAAGMAEVLKQTARKEIHVWNQVHGRWVRDEAGIVLLKLAK